MPALNRLVPPHGPFPARQPVDRLEVHNGAKSFNVIHGIICVFADRRVSFNGFGTHGIDSGTVFHALKNMFFPVRDAFGISRPADEAQTLTTLVIYFQPNGEVNDAEIEKADRFRGHHLGALRGFFRTFRLRAPSNLIF